MTVSARKHEVMRDADANETSGELGSALCETLVGVSQLRIPWSDPLIESAIFLPLVSVDPEYQDGWCALKSPRIRLSFCRQKVFYRRLIPIAA